MTTVGDMPYTTQTRGALTVGSGPSGEPRGSTASPAMPSQTEHLVGSPHAPKPTPHLLFEAPSQPVLHICPGGLLVNTASPSGQ